VEAWESQVQRFDALGSLRGAMPGLRYTLDRGIKADPSSPSEREYIILSVDWAVRNNVPGLDAYPAFEDSLRGELEARAAGQASAVVSHADGSEGFFLVRVESQRRAAPFRLPLEHHKPPMSLMSAIVDAPGSEEIFTDRLNRVRVRFPWYRDDRSSCWMRAAFADAGGDRGAIQPLRKGDEVLVDFVGGDCDRPVIVSRVYGGTTEPVWHTNGLLSGIRSKEYGGAGFGQLVFDDSTAQHRVQLYSSSYQTHLHLGYLIEHRNNQRGAFLGSGFDLKSDAYGALRAGQGLFVSTHPTSTEQPLDMAAAAEQLASAKQVADLASKASESNRAEGLSAALSSLDRFEQSTRYKSAGSIAGGRTAGGGDGVANGFGAPVILLATPAGLGLSTQDSMQATANQHVNVVSGRNTHVAAGKSFLVSALEKVTLFVQNAGMRLFAAKGKVEIEAQSDAMALSALKDVTITSANGRLVLSADKEIWIGAGGSYIRITGDFIENGTTGQILEKCANWDKPGAASMRMPTTLASVENGCAWKTAGAAAEGASSVELS
jgi:type VI secretion system secreted protein VgrG